MLALAAGVWLNHYLGRPARTCAQTRWLAKHGINPSGHRNGLVAEVASDAMTADTTGNVVRFVSFGPTISCRRAAQTVAP